MFIFSAIDSVTRFTTNSRVSRMLRVVSFGRASRSPMDTPRTMGWLETPMLYENGAQLSILLFDRDCGICSALSRWIGAADVRHRIRVRTIQSSRELLRGIPDDRMLDAFHIVAPNGQLTTGGDAVPTLIEALPMGAGFGRILRSSQGLMSRVTAFYGFLTRFRDQLVCRVAFGETSEGSPRW